jgi:hypothetical protein
MLARVGVTAISTGFDGGLHCFLRAAQDGACGIGKRCRSNSGTDGYPHAVVRDGQLGGGGARS